VSFSPDGSNALYAGGFYDDENYEGITRIDFATGRKTLLIDDANDVYAPLYSKDGSRFAFTRTITSGDQRYDQLFVANADGTDVRQLTTAAVGNLAYTAVEWSDDGSQLLVDRFLYTDQIPRVPLRKVLRIVDVNTGAIKGLPGGYAYGGGWFNH
jgi:Tol biopolymer transport system component